MFKKLIVAAALVISASSVLALQPVTATSNSDGLASHCPDKANSGKVNNPAAGSSTKVTVDGTDVYVNVSSDLKSVTFTDASGKPVKVEFCIKASDKAGGKQTGTSGSVYWKNNGGQTPAISYVIVYKVGKTVTPQEPKQVDVCDPKTGDVISVPEDKAHKYLPVGDEACEDEDDVPPSEEDPTPKPEEEPKQGGKGQKDQVEVPENLVAAGAGPVAGTAATLGLLMSSTALMAAGVRKLSAFLEK